MSTRFKYRYFVVVVGVEFDSNWKDYFLEWLIFMMPPPASAFFISILLQLSPRSFIIIIQPLTSPIGLQRFLSLSIV